MTAYLKAKAENRPTIACPWCRFVQLVHWNGVKPCDQCDGLFEIVGVTVATGEYRSNPEGNDVRPAQG